MGRASTAGAPSLWDIFGNLWRGSPRFEYQPLSFPSERGETKSGSPSQSGSKPQPAPSTAANNVQQQPPQPNPRVNDCVQTAQSTRTREKVAVAVTFALGSAAEFGCVGTGPGEVLCANVVFWSVFVPSAAAWQSIDLNYQNNVNTCMQTYGEP